METRERVLNFAEKDENDDDDDDDDKENAEEKRISDESKISRGNREADKIFPQQQQRQQVNRSPRRKSAGIPTLLCIDGGGLTDATAVEVKRKIPRPANAFMLFANEWRRKLAAENPRESNKDISVRLGIFWKNMSKDVKEKYFALAREVDREHKRKYPGTSRNRRRLLIFGESIIPDDYGNNNDDDNVDDDEEEVVGVDGAG
ncbi:hypothetical protein ACFW04_010247 [Cataglyphis niger]